jgi:hypothetical protein
MEEEEEEMNAGGTPTVPFLGDDFVHEDVVGFAVGVGDDL